MQAIIFRVFGPPSVLQYVDDWPLPPLKKSGEVLVAVKATAVNPLEFKLRRGFMGLLLKRPTILGSDVAGVVEQVPAGSKFKKGDEVFGSGPGSIPRNPWGSYASFYACPERHLLLKPASLSFVEAASVPITALTAWQALLPAFPLEGKRVLIHAGAGGVGGSGIQIAKALGAHVTTTCSTRNVEYVTKELGADVAVDYSKGEKFEEQSPFDVVVNPLAAYEQRSLKAIKKSGHFSHIVTENVGGLLWLLLTSTVKKLLGIGPRSYKLILVNLEASAGLEEISALVAQGKFKPHVEKVFPLKEAAAAHALSETGRVRGKIVLQVSE